MKNVKLILLDDSNVRAYKIANSLKENGYNVEGLLVDKKNVSKDTYLEEVINGINVKKFFCRKIKDTTNYNKVLKKIIYFKWFMNFIKKLKKYLKNENCDYLICQANIGTFAGIKAKKKGTKVIYDMRELYEGRGKRISPILKMFNKYLYIKCNYIIYLNDKQKTMIPNKYHKKLIYLPNYTEKSHYKKIGKNPYSKLRIGYVGCPRDELSLTNLANSVKNNEKMEVHIYGMGDCYEKMKELSNKINNLFVYGEYNGIKDSEAIFQNVDVLFCGYNIENINWKNAIAVKFFEAILTITPIITFRDSKMGDLVDEYNIGYLIDENTVDGFQETIKLINKDSIIDKKNSLKKIQYDFTWDKVISNLIDKIK